jgi:hypothetical protein
MNRFFNTLAEATASTWRLLSDTTNFLSRARLLTQYEQELKGWRDRLQRFRNDPVSVRQIREEVVALRRGLRLQGHDLRLGSKDIHLEGFRHDDAMGEGFRRLVLCLTESEIYYVAGDLNHIALGQMLEDRLRRSPRRHQSHETHYLWYRWRKDVLVLSGAASETQESFETLREHFEENKNRLLRALSRL